MGETEKYLAHYGVPGMMWGVRHSREYLARKRGEHLIKKANNRTNKASRLQNKAQKSRYGITDTGRTVWENRQIKAGKATRKALKSQNKAKKWIAKHEKEFSTIRLSDLKDFK